MPAVQRIVSTDSLENGFRARYNATVDAIIDASALSCDANGVLSFYNDRDVLLGSIDLSEYFKLQNESSGVDGSIPVDYPSASEENEGLIRFATPQEALLGQEEFAGISPATLKYVLDRLGNVPIILTGDAQADQTLKLVRDSATNQFYLTNTDAAASGPVSGAATLDDVLKAGTDATRGKSDQPIELGGRITLTPGNFDLIGASGYPILTVNEEGHVKLTNGLSLGDLLQLISSRDLMLVSNADIVHVINTSSETRERTGQKFYVDSYERGRAVSVDGALEDYYRDATGEYTTRLESNKWVTNVANFVARNATALFNLISFRTLQVAKPGQMNLLVAEQAEGEGAYTIRKGSIEQLFTELGQYVTPEWLWQKLSPIIDPIITQKATAIVNAAIERAQLSGGGGGGSGQVAYPSGFDPFDPPPIEAIECITRPIRPQAEQYLTILPTDYGDELTHNLQVTSDYIFYDIRTANNAPADDLVTVVFTGNYGITVTPVDESITDATFKIKLNRTTSL